MDHLPAAGCQLPFGGDPGAAAFLADGHDLLHAWFPWHGYDDGPDGRESQGKTCATSCCHVMHPGMIELKPRFKTVRACLSLRSDLAREGRRLAKSYRMSFSAYVTMLLDRDLAERKRKEDLNDPI